MSTEPTRHVGALVVDDDGRIFLLHRSADRPLAPDSWEIVDGRAEPDESAESALGRALIAETGWTLFQILGTVGEYSFTGDDGGAALETTYLVRVEGDLSRPRLTAGRHRDPHWLAEPEIALLDDPPGAHGNLTRRVVEDGFALIRRIISGG